MTSSSERSYAAPAAVGRAQRLALGIGVVGAIASALGFFQDAQQFYASYLLGYTFWLEVALGCLGLLMVSHLSGGDWGVVMRRVLEAAAGTFPVLFVFFLPLIPGMKDLFPWARPEVMAASEILQHKAPYLNATFWIERAVLYFVLWTVLAALLRSASRKHDGAPSPSLLVRMRTLSGPGLVIFVLTVSFASYDWLMSLEPLWFSTMYGVYFIGGMGLAALAMLILVGVFLAGHEPMSGALFPRHFHDYGKLMFAFVLLWAYFSISQFLITWSGNLPEEISWYLHRFGGGWLAIATALLVLHFALPFLLLLSERLKRDPKRLAWVALFLLVMRWVDLYWQIVPAFSPEAVKLSWMDLAATVAVGGLWLCSFFWLLERRALLPVNDPHLEEAVAEEALGHG